MLVMCVEFCVPLATERMTTTNSTTEQVEQSEQPAGFEFDTGNGSHEIEADYSWRYVDRIYVTDDGQIVRAEDTDGYYGQDESFTCSCGETFASEGDAKAHLRDEQVRGPPVPTADQPGELSWQDEVQPAFDGCVEYVPSTAQRARDTYTPPANYGFEDWEPLQAGRLSNHRNDSLFSARLLSRAVATLSNGYQYTPDRYTLYFRGHEPLYLEGPEGGIAVAELTPQV